MDSFIGVIFGAMLAIWVVHEDIHSGAAKMIHECELNLPRTEKCMLIAVPESTQGNGSEQN